MRQRPLLSASGRFRRQPHDGTAGFRYGCIFALPKKEYKAQLQKAKVSSREDFNIRLNRYQKDYDRDDLWEKYFLHLPELRQIIQQRRIGSLTELAYRAAEYFERYTYEIEPI